MAPRMPGDVPAPTLFATNPTCAGGTCQEIDMLVSMWLPRSDGTKLPGDITLALGSVPASFDGPSKCWTFPPVYRMELWINADSLTFTWRPDDPEGVQLALSSAAPLVGGKTRTFVPGDAPGWDLTFAADTESDGVHYLPQVSADTVACVPSS